MTSSVRYKMQARYVYIANILTQFTNPRNVPNEMVDVEVVIFYLTTALNFVLLPGQPLCFEVLHEN